VSRKNVARGDDLKVGPTECIELPKFEHVSLNSTHLKFLVTVFFGVNLGTLSPFFPDFPTSFLET